MRDTGVSEKHVKSTLELLEQAGKKVWLRCPVVPGYQDRREHFHKIAALEKKKIWKIFQKEREKNQIKSNKIIL